MIEQWYLANIQMLMGTWGSVEYDDDEFSWLRINYFVLPAVYFQEYSSLLFVTPGYNLDNFQDYHFYVDPDLSRRDGVAPPFVHENHECNNLYDEGYARLSFHLTSFRATNDVVSGDNFLELAKAVHLFLAQE